MWNATGQHSRRVLEPADRLAEVMFGLILMLAFTGALGIAIGARNDMRAMWIGALACGLAWALIDSIIHLLFRLGDRSQGQTLLLAIRRAPEKEGQQLVADSLPSIISDAMDPAELETVRERLSQLEPAAHIQLDIHDWLGALAIFALMFLATLPVALPFGFMEQVGPAMRVSNIIAVAMLFIVGCGYGRSIGRPAWMVGSSMVVLGGLLMAITQALAA